jgi:hypothetical protein
MLSLSVCFRRVLVQETEDKQVGIRWGKKHDRCNVYIYPSIDVEREREGGETVTA